MQNKGAIRLFAILLVLASIYSLSFTYFTRKAEKQAEEFAQGDPIKESNYLDSIKSKPLYNFFWIKEFTYGECKEKELNFGLDLQGGMNVTLEISVVDLLKSLSNDAQDSSFVAALNGAQKLQEDSQEGFVNLFVKAFQSQNPQGRLAPLFISPENSEITYDSSNDDVAAFLLKEAKSAIDNSFNILNTRINHFGVSQPNIQSLGGGRILVELPGVKDPERVRKLLQGTAQLEFWETYEFQEIAPVIQEINLKIAELQGYEEEPAVDTAVAATADSVELAVADSVVADSAEELSLKEQLAKGGDDDSDLDSVAKAEKQVKEFFKKNPLHEVIQFNRGGRGPMIGYVHIKDTSKVNAYFRDEAVKAIMPRDLKLLWSVKSPKGLDDYYELIAIKVPSLDGKAPLTGDVVTDARRAFGQTQATAQVDMTMNAEGASTWARLTEANLKRSIAIVLDDYVYSYPTVQSSITGGRSQISGNFTIKEAEDLANVLKSGKLPAPARIIEEVVVGPSLGAEAVQAGLWSFVIAFILVLIYMIFYYNKAGYVANLALIINVFLIVGVLSSLGAVLTLPGIAGIVLTVGMSVDANVLIYERIREELARGKGIKIALTDGYKNAYSSIIDANVTTLLTGVILFVFGSGPIQGFATTLIIGIVTSLFSAIFITRLVFERMLGKQSKIAFDTSLTRNAFKNTKIDFVGKRKQFLMLSLAVIVVGVVSIAVRGWDMGVDFKGGRTYVIRFDEPVQVSEVTKSLSEVFDGDPDVKTYGEDNQVRITTDFLIGDKTKEADEKVEEALFQGLQSYFDGISKADFLKDKRMQSNKVGPTIADDIVWGAVLSIIFSLIVIFLYIFIRFQNWQYGLGALVALFHDVLIVLGIFSLLYAVVPFSLEIGQSFIAAILTVIGYSINDTVVVFDRVREFKSDHPNMDTKELFNKALNSTMSRTFSTSLSTLVVLLAIFIFGGETIRGFIFAMIIGVVVGTYSSLFVASPVVYQTIQRIKKKA